MKGYNLTEDVYREKIREVEETMEQFIFRKKTYMEKWMELSESNMTYEGLRDLMVKEQVIDTCPHDLSIYLQEMSPRDRDEMAKLGGKFLKAR